MSRKAKKGMQALGNILKDWDISRKKYISHEFQDYGLRLAKELGDDNRKSLYIRLAKTQPREVLEQARIFVKDASNVKSKSRLFMWKMKQLNQERKEKDKKKKPTKKKNKKRIE
jgi:hypothetical protein